MLLVHSVQETEVSRQKKVILQFACRTSSNVPVALKLPISPFATAPGDIGRNGCGTSAYLAGHAV